MRLYGKNPVFERLRSNPQSIRKIFMQVDFDEAGYVHKKAKKSGISVHIVPRSKMIKLTRDFNAQGILIDIDDFAYIDYSDLLDEALAKKLTLVFIDSLSDPQNFGAILRSLACLSGFAVVVGSHGCVSVTDTVMRVASGGENYVKVAKVSNINNAIRSAKQAGFTIAGTVVQEGQSIYDVKFTFPLGFVIGSEQKGVRDVIKKELDELITIPMSVHTLSMNVAAATTIFAYEITRQKKIS